MTTAEKTAQQITEEYATWLLLHEREALAKSISEALTSERDRCLSIVKAIETRNPSEAHLIETIVRKMRGDE